MRTPEDISRIHKTYCRFRPDLPFFRVNISATLTEIPGQAFLDCRTLVEVVFLESGSERSSRLRRIGTAAFYGCIALRRFVQGLPPGVLRIERGAFFDCAQLDGELMIPHTTLFLGEGCFARCASLRSVVFEAASVSSSSTTTRTVRIENSAFSGCTALRAIR